MSTDQAAFFAEAEQRPEPKRNQWGQYLIPDPETGKERSWVRATTWCKTLASTFALEQWGNRQVAVGLAKRPDLVLQVQSIRDPDHADAKKAINGICSDAKEAAGSSMRSNLGTALHRFAESLDKGDLEHMPAEPYARDLRSYQAALSAHGITVPREHMERVVIVPELGVAGTYDRLLEVPEWGDLLVVGDLKTGRTMEYSWSEVAIQLALYSRATHIFDVASGELSPMPAVNQERAIVMHMPVGEGTTTIYEVQLEDAWRMASVCGTVRDWRNRKNLATPMVLPGADPFSEGESSGDSDAQTAVVQEAGSPSDPFADDAVAASSATQQPGPLLGAATHGDAPAAGAPAMGAADPFAPEPQPPATELEPDEPFATAAEAEPIDRAEWAIQRLRACKGNDAAMAYAAERWPHALPKPPGPWDDAQLHTLLELLTRAEAAGAVAFPEHSDPELEQPPAAEPDAEPGPSAPAARAVKSGRKVSALRRTDLQGVAKTLEQAQRGLLTTWMRQGREADWSWDTSDDMPERIYEVVRAALACVLAFSDDEAGEQADVEALTRACLSFCWSGDAIDDSSLEPWASSWSTGAAFGALSTKAAREVRIMADDCAAGDAAKWAQLGEVAVLEP